MEEAGGRPGGGGVGGMVEFLEQTGSCRSEQRSGKKALFIKASVQTALGD